VERWLVTRWRSEIEQISRDSCLEREHWLSPGALAALAREAATAGGASMQLWFLLVLEHWMAAGKGAHADPAPACH
jgi:hypothetical protein